MMSALIVIGGLPCSGKTTLAKAVSKRLSIPIISKDEIEAAIARKGLAGNKDMRGVGYEVMATLAKSYVDSGSSVIFDFIASKNRVLECWPQLLDGGIKYIECVCSDEEVHKERVQSRSRGIDGWYELTWAEVLKVKANYEPLFSESVVLDSVNELAENVELAVEYINS